jgi:hypothetical protein
MVLNRGFLLLKSIKITHRKKGEVGWGAYMAFEAAAERLVTLLESGRSVPMLCKDMLL